MRGWFCTEIHLRGLPLDLSVVIQLEQFNTWKTQLTLLLFMYVYEKIWNFNAKKVKDQQDFR